MSANNNFQIALLFSVLAHTTILINYPAFNFLNLGKKPLMVKITYLKGLPKVTGAQKQLLNKKTSQVKLPSQVSSFDKNTLVPPSSKESLIRLSRSGLPHNQAAIKPVVVRAEIISVKKNATLPPVELDKLNNPSYLSYYQFVREKIRRAAYQNYSRTEIGEVYLAFVISSKGILMDVKLIDDKSSQNYYLRETALRSVRDASPFPMFPQDIDYPQLSFNVIISFELE